MLNPNLYAVLLRRFGEVRITNEDVDRVEVEVGDRTDIINAGESYNVDCPLCGDTRKRLSISYRWLTKRHPLTNDRIKHLANCYNENCDVRSDEFCNSFLEDLRAAELGLLDNVPDRVTPRAVKERAQLAKLPGHLVRLSKLPDDHPALIFLRMKYKGVGNRVRKFADYLSSSYDVGYVESDEVYRLNKSILFPINKDGKLVGWQARATDPDDSTRWRLMPGFKRCFYNMDRVPPHETPIICEGITSSIFSGPTALAIFGKTLNTLMAEELGNKYRSCMIATDPETFVSDSRESGSRTYADVMRKLLASYIPAIKTIKWPDEILDLAKRKVKGEDVEVPDAADLGFSRMREIIERSDNA